MEAGLPSNESGPARVRSPQMETRFRNGGPYQVVRVIPVRYSGMELAGVELAGVELAGVELAGVELACHGVRTGD